MAFHNDAVFDFQLTTGSRYRPGFRTAIVEVAGGGEQRVQNYETVRHGGEVGIALRDWTQLQLVRDFFIARMGATYGFRFPDPSDHSSAIDGHSAPSPTDQYLGEGDGTNVQFQLRKQYIQGLTVRNRLIRYPVASTVTIAIDDVPTTNFTVDDSTGTVTMGLAPGAGATVKAGFLYHNGVRFGEDTDQGLDISFEEFENGAVPQVELIELIDERPLSEEMPAIGARVEALTTDITLSLYGGGYVDLTPDVAGHTVFLPEDDALEPGPAYFYIKNNSTNFSFGIRYFGGGFVTDLDPLKAAVIHLARDTATNNFWSVTVIS